MEEDFPRPRHTRERQEHDLRWRHTILVEFALRVVYTLARTPIRLRPAQADLLNYRTDATK